MISTAKFPLFASCAIAALLERDAEWLSFLMDQIGLSAIDAGSPGAAR